MLKFAKHWKKFRAWLDTPLGRAFLGAEIKCVHKMLPRLFGYHLLLLGEPQFVKALSASSIMHRVWIHRHTLLIEDCNALTSRLDKLPILADSVDVVYLAHCLEFNNNPHEILRETFRILIAEGHVIITNFNPWSIWGIWRWLVRFIKPAAWDGAFISVARLQDWLALLGFDVMQVTPYFFRPPISHAKVLHKIQWLEKIGRWCWPFWSAGYTVLAKKRVITLTPIVPILKKARPIEVPGITEPVRLE